MSTPSIRITRENHCLHLQFTRPDKKNALTLEMYDEASDALESVQSDDDIRVVLFSGAGPDFCAGNDIQTFLDASGDESFAPILRFLHALAKLDCPKLAAVEGYAVGIGATLLLHCDAVVASTTAKFRFSFAELGLCPEAGSTQLLPKRVGSQQAFELFILGTTWDASQALRGGLISSSVEVGKALEHARSLVDRIVQLPVQSMRTTYELLTRPAEPIAERIDAEAKAFVQLLSHEDTQNRFQSFLMRRTKKAPSGL